MSNPPIPQGRYVLLNCDRKSTSFTLANIYAPNLIRDRLGFLEEFFEKLQPFSQPFMVTLTYACHKLKIDLPSFQIFQPPRSKKFPPHFENWSRLTISLTLGGWSTLLPNNSHFILLLTNYTRDWTIFLSRRPSWHMWIIQKSTRSPGRITHP